MRVPDWIWSIIWAAAGVWACGFILIAILFAAVIVYCLVKEVRARKHDKW